MDWNKIPDGATIDKTMAGMRGRNFNPVLVETRQEALARLRQILPPKAEVMTGSSTTLEEMGFIDLLAGNKHPWQNWKDRIFAEKDAERQANLRRLSTTAEYFIGSVQAIMQSGQVLGCDATGSRQGGYVFSAKNVIWVVGVNKLVPDLDAAFRRLREYCVPLEDARMKRVGFAGTSIGKIVIYEREAVPNRISAILVKEKLGF